MNNKKRATKIANTPTPTSLGSEPFIYSHFTRINDALLRQKDSLGLIQQRINSFTNSGSIDDETAPSFSSGDSIQNKLLDNCEIAEANANWLENLANELALII